ncbi:DUF6290 family protein [Aerococcus urinae]|uniref:type II toxin-antitoxin system RelB family antitoxin n=1 Tax=Aerococcus TaxID=1375 RepID=UPI000DCDAE87|nr:MULTISPECIES: DUF6290 family protein [Aerococcus]MCY3034487.1 DUF6290 family protein [Aerococcus mictus]MCY3063441.1 DUF6290 family protein [Aerococcus mictus]MCY3072944.1 DUF6290 family protein [Aerococcus mictus]MCY3084020.1 DUF6290 family protein [Aerococcus mictus]MDK7196313.1 DUF6290 family protein [Aerococcus urinae]
MSKVSIPLNKDEEKLFKQYAKFHNKPLSTLFKESLEEKIEEDFDLEAIKDYESTKETGGVSYYSHNEVRGMLGL